MLASWEKTDRARPKGTVTSMPSLRPATTSTGPSTTRRERLLTSLSRRGGAMGWIASTHGVIILMTLIMLGMTIVILLDYHSNELPGKWWHVAASSTAVGCGVWAMRAGSTPTIRYWCGIFWVAFGVLRSLSWLLAGSLSGALSWLPCVLLGLVVFARRGSAPYVRAEHEPPT